MHGFLMKLSLMMEVRQSILLMTSAHLVMVAGLI